MKFIKLTIVLVAVIGLTVPAWAGTPEYDAWGNDSANPFALYNPIQYGQVNLNDGGLNENSDFVLPGDTPFGRDTVPPQGELFKTSAGDLFADPCFGRFGVGSAYTSAFNEATYEWRIVLQLKPQSDINLNIYDCVKEFESEIYSNRWARFAQTGRYFLPWNEIVWDEMYNPEVSVTAWPGKFATPGFVAPFKMDARTLPGLATVAMENQLYTSKALWSEGIVLIRPETGEQGASGDTFYALKQGDIIQVQVYINPLSVDLYYGPDNVILKYIGFTGNRLFADQF